MDGRFPTDWDVDKYYSASDEHWALKRRFMTMHKDKYPEQELVDLTDTFINVEMNGCIYPTLLMTKVAELSRYVPKTYDEIQKTKIHREFLAMIKREFGN